MRRDCIRFAPLEVDGAASSQGARLFPAFFGLERRRLLLGCCVSQCSRSCGREPQASSHIDNRVRPVSLYVAPSPYTVRPAHDGDLSWRAGKPTEAWRENATGEALSRRRRTVHVAIRRSVCRVAWVTAAGPTSTGVAAARGSEVQSYRPPPSLSPLTSTSSPTRRCAACPIPRSIFFIVVLMLPFVSSSTSAPMTGEDWHKPLVSWLFSIGGRGGTERRKRTEASASPKLSRRER